MAMAGAIWCIVEDDRKGTPKKVMAEVLGEATRLGLGPVEAVWLTDTASEAGLTQLAEWGASRVVLLEHAVLAPYRAEVWARVLADLAAAESPRAILAPVTSRQRELMARLAARLGVGLAADCVSLAAEGDRLIATRPVYAGKLLARVTWAKTPWMVTLRPNVFRPAEAQAGRKAAVDRPALTPPAAVMKFVERREEAATGLPELTEAEVVISGGRGMKGPENYVILEKMAGVIGAAVGASRAAVDAGWRPHRFQIGQTGRTISPKLYMGFGVSGAIQHLAGMRTSKVIVAVNKDPEAPIFKIADYGIVADLFEVVPALTEELKKLKEQS
jgi:electron transfer flavoprotein alpha subunit